MAVNNFSSAKKPHVYELLSRLNASFARASRNLFELEKFGIFDSGMMHKIYNQTKEVQASANYHLLETMQDVEELDWARFGRAGREQRNG
ncbi:MAG: hypothetical protein LAP21_01380 [Acidobacteriia bacterium]|nr:hypothetical protein [Terriglobia bacterium]